MSEQSRGITKAIGNVPFVGSASSGRWIGIGIARRALMASLSVSADEACAALGQHLGASVAFKFADWSILASAMSNDRSPETMIVYRGVDDAPSLQPTVFRNLFFWGNEIDNLQWAIGTFGGMTGGRWMISHLGHRLRLHSFTANGTVVDEAALCKSFGMSGDLAPGISTGTGSSQSIAERKPGRKAGSDTYFSDAKIVQRAIVICDLEGFTVRSALKRLIDDIEPKCLADESKIRRLQPKVQKVRPDLA